MIKRSGNVYKEILHKYLGDKCELCSSRLVLQLHHKNFKYNDNDIKNIQLLCRKCHMEIHTKVIRERIKNIPKPNQDESKPDQDEIYTWQCVRCNKIIESIYQSQLDQNKEAHLISCKGRNKDGN